jgi:hypothetical protein
MTIGWGNPSTCRKPAPMPFCPPQIPHDLTLARSSATAVGSQRLTPEPWHGHDTNLTQNYLRNPTEKTGNKSLLVAGT